MIGPMQRTPPSTPAPQDEQPTVATQAQAQPPAAPSFRERGRLRRRLRYLRRVRELGFRDLGGLVFDLHRFGRSRDDLVQGKLAALQAVDREMRALETLLDDRHPVTELREPGISSCPRCGALHGSDARFCPSCGLQLVGARPMGEVGALPGAAPLVSAAPGAAVAAASATAGAGSPAPGGPADTPAGATGQQGEGAAPQPPGSES
jgi:hypothetical protein